MRRKLKHARKKLCPVPRHTASAIDSNVVKIYAGGEYYTLLTNGRYAFFKLLRYAKFTNGRTGYMAAIELLKADGSSTGETHDLLVPHFGLFIPRDKFEEECSPLSPSSADLDGSFADGRDDYSGEAYNKDLPEILSCLAASFPEFKLCGRLPSRAVENKYVVRNSSSGKCLEFVEVDVGMSFKPFFTDDLMPSWSIEQGTRLMKSAALEELYRCFFIHLGLALDVHPLALQVWFEVLRFVPPPPPPFFRLFSFSSRARYTLQ